MIPHRDRASRTRSLRRGQRDEARVAIPAKGKRAAILHDAVHLQRHLQVDLHLARGLQHAIDDAIPAADARVPWIHAGVQVVELHVPPRACGAVGAAEGVGVGVARRVLRSGAAQEFFKCRIENRVPRPIMEVEVPPLARIHREALPLEHATQQRAVPALQRCAAGEVGVGARCRFVIRGRHFDRRARLQIVQRDVDRGAAIMLGAFHGVGHEPARRGGRRVPKDLRHMPRPVGIVDQETVADRPEDPCSPHEREGGGTLEECMGRRVEDATEKVVGRRVSNVEPDRRIEHCRFHQIGRDERATLGRRRQRAIDAQ